MKVPDVAPKAKGMNPILARGRQMVAALLERRPQLSTNDAGTHAPSLSTRAQYMGGGLSAIMQRWMPALRDTQDDVRQSWTMATARATDAIVNSGWLTGGVRASVGNVLGSGLRLVARPDTTLVKFEGLTADNGDAIDADGWSRFVERRWEAWSNAPAECDYYARNTISQLAISAFKAWFSTGEIVTLLPFRRDSFAMTKTKVQVAPPHKLSQKTDPLKRIVQGVQLDASGRPRAYWFRVKGKFGTQEDDAVLARDGAGRPQVIHLFEGMPGQVRGITPLVPVLQVVKQYDQLANATLMAALIQAIFAATIESDLPTQELMAALQTESEQGVGGSLDSFIAARMGWHQSTTIDLNEQSKVAHLFPGEKLTFNRSEHPNSTYEAFVKVLLREMAMGLGVTVPQLTGDYAGVTYTGVRMSTTDVWQITLDRRDNLMARWYQAIYEAWLEEEIESGRVKFPGGIMGFLALRPSAVRAKWHGPAKPQADDLKTAKTHETYRKMGIMSDTQIAEDLGTRIEDVYEQRGREAKMREKFEVGDVGPSVEETVAKTAADAAAEDAAEDAEEPASEDA